MKIMIQNSTDLIMIYGQYVFKHFIINGRSKNNVYKIKPSDIFKILISTNAVTKEMRRDFHIII